MPADPASITLRAIDLMYGIYMQMYISDSIRISCQESMDRLLTQYFIYDPHPSAMEKVNDIIEKHAKGKGEGIIDKFSCKASLIFVSVQKFLDDNSNGNIK